MDMTTYGLKWADCIERTNAMGLIAWIVVGAIAGFLARSPV